MVNGGDNLGRNLEERIKSRIHNRMSGGSRYHGLIPGAIILAIGAIFLLNNMGIVRAGNFL